MRFDEPFSFVTRGFFGEVIGERDDDIDTTEALRDLSSYVVRARFNLCSSCV